MQTENTMITILSQNICLNLNDKKYNNNVLAIGCAGSAKTIGFVYPNIMHTNTNLIVTDFRKELYDTHADLLREKGYNVKLVDFEQMCGDHYNPLHYINKRDFKIMEQEILDMVNIIQLNTNYDNNSDLFYLETEQSALAILLLHCVLKRKEHVSFKGVFYLLTSIMENETSFGQLMSEIKEINPKSDIVSTAESYQTQLQNTIVPLGARLLPFYFYYEREKHLASYKNNPWCNYHDTLNLDTFGNKKNVIFVSSSMYNNEMSPLLTLFLHQVSYILMKQESKHITRFILDEFPNIGYIPALPYYLTKAMPHNLSYNILIQSICQLKDMYKNEWQQMLASCDSMLVCGVSNNDDACYISKLTGKIVISDPPVRQKQIKRYWFQQMFSKPVLETKRLKDVSNMTPDNIRRMERDKCIVFQKGCDAKMDVKCQDGFNFAREQYEKAKRKYDKNKR